MSASLVLRTVKGAPLTNLEIDNNFSNLNVFSASIETSLSDLSDNVGVLTNLTTTATGNIVAAVNELDSNISDLVANVITTNSSGGISTAMIGAYQVTSAKMSNSGVTASTYGGSSQIPVIAIDGAGRITSAANIAVSLGTIAAQNANNVAITGGTVVGITTLTASGGSLEDMTSIASSDVTTATANVTSSLYVGAYNYKRVDLGTVSSNVTIDMSTGNYFKCSIQSGSTVYFLTNNAPAGTVTTGFVLEMSGGGAATVSLASLGSSDTKFQGGGHPTISSYTDLYSCITSDNGSTFLVLPIFVDGQ